MKLVVFRIKRHKKRNSLNVIPMIVGDENVGFRISPGLRNAPARTKGTQTCSAIQNELRSVRSDQFEARRVAAVAPSGGIDRRRRTADTPKAKFCDRDRHFFARCPWKRSLPHQ